jgi:hypothetical protein
MEQFSFQYIIIVTSSVELEDRECTVCNLPVLCLVFSEQSSLHTDIMFLLQVVLYPSTRRLCWVCVLF